MNLDAFLANKQAHERQVTMPDGSQHTLHFLKPSAADIRRWLDAEKGEDESRRLYAMQALIAACLYDIKQKCLAFSDQDHDKYQQLTWDACMCLLPPIWQLGGFHQQKKA